MENIITVIGTAFIVVLVPASIFGFARWMNNRQRAKQSEKKIVCSNCGCDNPNLNTALMDKPYWQLGNEEPIKCVQCGAVIKAKIPPAVIALIIFVVLLLVSLFVAMALLLSQN